MFDFGKGCFLDFRSGVPNLGLEKPPVLPQGVVLVTVRLK